MVKKKYIYTCIYNICIIYIWQIGCSQQHHGWPGSPAAVNELERSSSHVRNTAGSASQEIQVVWIDVVVFLTKTLNFGACLSSGFPVSPLFKGCSGVLWFLRRNAHVIFDLGSTPIWDEQHLRELWVLISFARDSLVVDPNEVPSLKNSPTSKQENHWIRHCWIFDPCWESVVPGPWSVNFEPR